MEKIKISIVVPVYNVERYIKNCLDTLIGQTMQEIELICVNDGSMDRSLDILKEYAERDERIIVLDQKNTGVSIARNNALKHVKGEYYMFVDSDDWLDLNTCEVAYNYVVQNQADCLMFSYTKEFGDHSIVNHVFDRDHFVWVEEEVRRKFHRRLFGPIGEELAQPQNMDIIVSPCMQLFKSSKFVNIPFVDIREVGTFEDGLYQMVLYKDCKRFVYIDRPFYHYRKTNEASITTRYKADLSTRWQNMFDYMEKYIEDHSLGQEYQDALRNRIALSTLGAGINQAHSDDSLLSGGKHMKQILVTERYKAALTQLDTSAMPIAWKAFFFLAKHKQSTFLFAMLKIIEYLRNHKK